MGGMMSLRLRGEEKKKLIKYDAFLVLTNEEIVELIKLLKKANIRWWRYDEYMCTYDERFETLCSLWLHGMEAKNNYEEEMLRSINKV